jgi:hypothetical protein
MLFLQMAVINIYIIKIILMSRNTECFEYLCGGLSNEYAEVFDCCFQYLARALQDMQRYGICTNYTIKIIMAKS